MRWFVIVLTAVLLVGCRNFTSSRTNSRSSIRFEDSPGAVASMENRVSALTAKHARLTAVTNAQPTQYLVVPSAADARALAESEARNEALNRQVAERERIIVELKRCPAPVLVIKPEPKVCHTQPPVPALVPCPVITPAPTQTHTETGNKFNIRAGRDVNLNVEIESSTVIKDESQVQRQIREFRRDIRAAQGLMDEFPRRNTAHRR